MKNNAVEIVQTLKKSYGEVPQKLDYEMLSTNVNNTMRNVVATQKIFDLKKASEGSGIITIPTKVYFSIMQKLGNRKFGEWDFLFETQLNNVHFLNDNLATLIKGASAQNTKFQYQISEALKDAKNHNESRLTARDLAPEIHKKYLNAVKELEELSDENPEFYDKMNEVNILEGRLTEGTQEVSLTSSTHRQDLSKIELLKKHLAFHRGVIFSAKGLAITTRQMYGTLTHLVGVYSPLKHMGDCVDAIHKGVSSLRGYTDVLNDTYHSTFEKLLQIENDKMDQYNSSNVQLDQLVGGMFDNLQQKLIQE